MKLNKLKLKDGNPRAIKDDRFGALVESLKNFPHMLKLRPIVYDPDTMEVLGGNMRLLALKELGYKDIPDDYIMSAETLTEEEKRRFTIVDNVGFGEWDWDILANEWDDAELADWGFDMSFLDRGEQEDTNTDDEGNFDDEGIQGKNQYGVIVMCEDDAEQEKVFNTLTEQGYNCKVVVT